MAVSYPKELSKCSNEEIYLALLEHVKKTCSAKSRERYSREREEEIILYFCRVSDWKTLIQQSDQFRDL